MSRRRSLQQQIALTGAAVATAVVSAGAMLAVGLMVVNWNLVRIAAALQALDVLLRPLESMP